MTTNYVWDINRGIPVILQDGDSTYVHGLGLVSTTDGSGSQTYRMTDGLLRIPQAEAAAGPRRP